MSTTSATALLGTSRVNCYQVQFYNKNEKVVAKVYLESMKIGKCILEGLPIRQWAYEALTDLDRLKIHQILCQKEQIISKQQVADVKQNPSEKENDSDEEFANLNAQKGVFAVQKKVSIPPSAMTISCRDQNIKGSTLIEIVHDTIQAWYEGVIDYACEYEKDIEGAVIPPPAVKKGILSIRAPREWFMSLGGWKGMMPSKEIKEYFFYQFESKKETEEKFVGVEIYQNGLIYPLINHRIHLPKKFSINQFDVTGFWEKQENKWVKIPSGKTDLSYSQIVDAIDEITNSYKLNDSQIATLQLRLLSRESGKIQFRTQEEISETKQLEIIQFLDYLNGLMFGIEASGLNAALAISLMTLDLIVNARLSYQAAFKANTDGGIYPYACFGNNSGTYSAREKILLHKKANRDSYSMKAFRENPSLSPVAVKEAILVKEWLVFNKVIFNIDYSSQKLAIELAIADMINYYFAPWVKRSYFLGRFFKETDLKK